LSLPVMVLLVAVATLLAVLQWLSPPVSPTLYVLSTQNASSVLPPNDPALGDAAAVRSLKDVFEVSATPAGKLNAQPLSLALKEIEKSEPKPPVLTPWKPTELIVYVNMVGVRKDPAQEGPGQAHAWLVPEGFDPDKNLGGQLVSVRQLFEAVAKSKATRKLVILDCQRMAVNPHFGLSTEDFVEAVQLDLSELPPEIAGGISVLCSCGPQEVAWPMRDRACTAFGHFFIEGVSGAADGVLGSDQPEKRDRRVTLDELAEYLKTQVNGWTSLNCDATQNPFLVNPATAGEFTLSVLGERFTPATTVAPARSALAGDLSSTFEKVYAVGRRPAPPDDWTPVQWAMIYHDLAAAERFYRSGNVEGASQALRRVDSLLSSVASTHEFLRKRINELAPSSRQFLAQCCAAGWPGVPEILPAPAAAVITQVIDGSLSPADADKALADIVRDNPELLPPAAQWARLASARSHSGVELDPGVLRDVIALRQTAEVVARPGHPLAEVWMRSSLAAADAARHDAEDHVLLQGWSPLEMGTPATATGSARAKYEEAAAIKESITRAYRLRDRLLTDLPYWISFVARAASHGTAEEPLATDVAKQPDARPYEGMSFPATARQAVDVLLAELKTLHAALLLNPGDLTADELASKLEEINKASVAIELQLARMEQELPKYAGSLADPRIAADGGPTWRRIDDLLVLPFPMVEKTADAASDAQNAAKLRAELLARTLPEFQPSETGQTVEVAADVAPESEAAATMFVELYSLPLRNPPAPESAVAELVSGRLYDDLVKLAAAGSRADQDRESVQRADVAFRLLQHGREAELIVDSPAIRLRVTSLKDCLTSQALRMCDDFYAANDQSRPPYFARVANELLNDARRLADVDRFLSQSGAPPATDAEASAAPATAGTSQIAQVAQEVQRLLTMLDSAQLRPDPAGLTFRGEAPEHLAVGLSDSSQFPAGTAALEVSTATPAGGDGAQVEFLVSRPSPGTDSAVATVYFRGHEFAHDVPLTVVGEFAGSTITYRHQNSGDAHIRFRANRVEQEPINLLFVLDCSGSMGLADTSGERRIDGLRRALNQFVQAVDGSNVRIGVRLFGRRVEDINSPDARTDTELAMPIGRLGVGTLESLRDLLFAKGHSPMFRALIDAKGDFGSVGAGRRVIVLISDGADNWALAGEKPGFDELLAAYQGESIQINTIGFNADNNADFAELRRIATAGSVDGRCLAVENAREVLEEMAGLVGLPGYRIIRDGEVVREESQFSSPGQSIDLPPGQYDIEILGAAGDVLTKRAVRLLPADEHVFVYDSGTLRYATSPAQSARAVTVGAADQPDLLVFDAQTVGDEFVVEFGLEQKLGDVSDLSPVSVRVTALADSVREREWVYKHLAPNVPDQHIPRWRVAMADWPASANQVEVEVVWNDLPEERIPLSLDWAQEFKVKAATDRISLVRRERQQIDLDGQSQTAVLLTFALSDPNGNIEDWGVSTSLPVVDVRQAYGRQHGMYTVQLVVSPNTELNEVTLFRSAPAPAGRTLKAMAPISAKRINP